MRLRQRNVLHHKQLHWDGNEGVSWRTALAFRHSGAEAPFHDRMVALAVVRLLVYHRVGGHLHGAGDFRSIEFLFAPLGLQTEGGRGGCS